MSTPISPDTEHQNISLKDLCFNRRWYIVNREYQREEDIWSGEDKKYLIDSILKGFDIPKIYLRLMPDKILEIVDGQQRIDTIWKFRDDKITLSAEITGKEYEGKQYSDLDDAMRKKFDDYELDAIVLKNYDDEKVRDLFTRLQRGKPLNPAERLNAYPGTIVIAMRTLGNNPFFKILNFGLTRYRPYLIAARMMLLQNTLNNFDSLVDIGPDKLYSFFMEHKDIDNNSREVQDVKQNLDYLHSAFIFKGGKVGELSSEVWVVNLYILTAMLRRQYVMKGKEAALVDFFTKFWREAEGMREMNIKPTLNKIGNEFVIANSSGTGSKDKLDIRSKELFTNFLRQTRDVEILDPNRGFTTYEKAVVYQKGSGVCAICGKQVAWDEFEADHIRPWSKGGKTMLDNAQLLCREDNRTKSAS